MFFQRDWRLKGGWLQSRGLGGTKPKKNWGKSIIQIFVDGFNKDVFFFSSLLLVELIRCGLNFISSSYLNATL